MLDLYTILELPPRAGLDEVRQSYRRLARRHHPDSGGDEEKMAALNAAFEVLSDPGRKADYDGRIKERPAGSTAQAPLSDQLYFEGLRFFSRGDLCGLREKKVKDEAIKRDYLREQIASYLKARQHLHKYLAMQPRGNMSEDAAERIKTLDRIIPIHQNELRRRPIAR